MNDQPAPDLTGRRVSVTHSGEGAEQLIQTLLARNATVHHVPLIQFALLDEKTSLATSQDVQWLVLTSPQGVKALSGVLDVRSVLLDVHWTGLKWAAVGESTARAMRQAGMPVHFMPSRATGTALGRELPLHGAGTVLHLTSDQSKNDLPDALLARGARYERLVLYRTVPRQPNPTELSLLWQADAVTIASSSAAQQLATLGGVRLPIVVMGEQTAHTARQLGFQRVTVALEPTLDSLKAAVIQFLTQT